jgi:hypothetical protein
MSVQTKDKRTDREHKALIERWTVERLDHDAGMARIEAVPMRSKHVTPALLDHLAQEGLDGGMDDLSLWEVDSIRTLRMPIRRLSNTLGLRSEEEETLSENMVFWVIVPGRGKKPTRVFHATSLSRKVSNDLYNRVFNRKGEAS